MEQNRDGQSPTALVADIMRSSFHDGPGLRTTVFFKGCPLACAWCHNPECIGNIPEPMFYPEKCINCGRCAQGCFSGARVVCGRYMKKEELLAEVLADAEYYGNDGGVTFSGGEPLAQAAFLREFIPLCRGKRINTALETSLIYFDSGILGAMQVVMADIKIWRDDLHKKYTGVGNRTILENFKKLDKLNVPIVVRTPLIPGVEAGVCEISAFARSLKNVVKYELLPYHMLGASKLAALEAAAPQLTHPGARRFEMTGEAHMKYTEKLKELNDRYAFGKNA